MSVTGDRKTHGYKIGRKQVRIRVDQALKECQRKRGRRIDHGLSRGIPAIRMPPATFSVQRRESGSAKAPGVHYEMPP